MCGQNETRRSRHVMNIVVVVVFHPEHTSIPVRSRHCLAVDGAWGIHTHTKTEIKVARPCVRVYVQVE